MQMVIRRSGYSINSMQTLSFPCAPVCWCHILCPHGAEDEAVKPLVKAEVAHKAFAQQLPAGASFRVTVAQLPHSQRTREPHRWGLCALFSKICCEKPQTRGTQACVKSPRATIWFLFLPHAPIYKFLALERNIDQNWTAVRINATNGSLPSRAMCISSVKASKDFPFTLCLLSFPLLSERTNLSGFFRPMLQQVKDVYLTVAN